MIPHFLLYIMIVIMPVSSVGVRVKAQSVLSNHPFYLNCSACHENTCNRFVNGSNSRLQGHTDGMSGDQIVRLACGYGSNLLPLTVYGEMQSVCGLNVADHEKCITFMLDVVDGKLTYDVRGWADMQLLETCSTKCLRSSVPTDSEMTCTLSEACIRHADTYESKVRLLGCAVRESVYGSTPRSVNGHFCESMTKHSEKLTSYLGTFEKVVLECARLLPTGFSLTMNTQWFSVYLVNVNSSARSDVTYVYITNASLSLSNHITVKTKSVDVFMDKAVPNTTFLTAVIALRSTPPTEMSPLKSKKELLEDTLNSDIVIVAFLDPRQKTLPHPIDLVLAHRKRANRSRCVFWEEFTHSWSDHGCRVLSVNLTHTHCTCWHLSSFAILLSMNDTLHQSPEENIISYIGSVVSVICLLVTLWTFTIVEGLKTRRRFVHKNIVGSLTAGYVLFMAGIHQTDTFMICKIIAILLHLVFLSVFMWMLLEGVFIYATLLLVKDHFCFTVSTVVLYVIGYGIPSFICAVTVVVMGNDYLAPETDVCWMSVRTRWIFIAPVLFVIVVNTFVFTIAVFLMCKHSVYTNIERSMLKKIKMWTRGVAMMIYLLGMSWSLELLHVTHHSVFYSVVITVFSSFQGFFIFFFCCLLDKKILTKYRSLVLRLGCLPTRFLYVGKQAQKKKSGYTEYNFNSMLLGWEETESFAAQTQRNGSVSNSDRSSQTTRSSASEPCFQSLLWSTITFFWSSKNSFISHSNVDEEADEVTDDGTMRRLDHLQDISAFSTAATEYGPSTNASPSQAHDTHGRKNKWRNVAAYYFFSFKKNKDLPAHNSLSKARDTHGHKQQLQNVHVELEDSGRKAKVQQSITKKIRDFWARRKEAKVTEVEITGKGDSYLTNDPINNPRHPDRNVGRIALDFLLGKREHEDHKHDRDVSYSGSVGTDMDEHVQDFGTEARVYSSAGSPDSYVHSSQEV